MKRSLVYLFIVACAVAGIWGYAYELAYFLVLKLNVHDTLTIQHFVASGLLNVLPLLGIVLVYSLIAKFLSPNLTRDELNHFQEEMKKSKFAQQASIARMSFVMSVAYLLLVAFDVRVYADMSLAYLFWLLIFINMQSFVGAIYLSPSQSRVPVIFAFVL